MNQKILSLALAASLLLNGFFIGGYWVAHRKAAELSSKTDRVEAIARRLNLTAEQKKIFQDLKKQARQIRKAHREQTRRLHHDLINRMVASSKQSEDTDRIVHDLATQQTLYQKKMVTLIQRFLAELTEEQKKNFLRISSGNKHLNALLSG